MEAVRMTKEERAHSDMVKRLLRELSSPNELKRRIAVHRAQTLPPDTARELMKRLLERYREQIAWESAFSVLGLLGVACGAASFMLGQWYLIFGFLGLVLARKQI